MNIRSNILLSFNLGIDTRLFSEVIRIYPKDYWISFTSKRNSIYTKYNYSIPLYFSTFLLVDTLKKLVKALILSAIIKYLV